MESESATGIKSESLTTFIGISTFVDFHGGLSRKAEFKGGRFEFFDGTELIPDDPQLRWIVLNEIQQRLIGNFGWSDIMRSFDGGQLRYGDSSWNVTIMAAVPTEGVFDLHGMHELGGINLVYAAVNAGPNVSWGSSLGRLFYIHYDDHRGLIPVGNQSPILAALNRLPIRIDTVGGDIAHKATVGPGAFDFLAWGAYQFGSWGNQAQRAYSYVGEIGYRFNSAGWQPWLRAKYTLGSGDSNPGDGIHGTFFQIMPTPRFYALDPFYNMMNSEDAGGDLILKPLKRIEWRNTLHGIWLTSSRDLWYAGGGAYNNGIFGYVGHSSFGYRYLATVLDSGFKWTINRHVDFSIYAGHAFGGRVIISNFNGNHEETLGYVETNFYF